jgi:hypothetical protein
MPSSPSSLRSFSKKEIKAKEKEEKTLMKELEKVDKMVRKHDKDAEKAAKKGRKMVEEEDNGAGNAFRKEGKTKRALKRITVFRSTSTANSTSLDRNMSLSMGMREGAAMDMRARNNLPPLVAVTSSPTKARMVRERNSESDYDDSSEDAQLKFSNDMWADVQSPTTKDFPTALTGVDVGQVKGTKIDISKRVSSLKRTSSIAAQRGVVKGEGDKNSKKRYSIIKAAPNYKKLSLLGSNSFTLGLDFGGESDPGWEDALESPIHEVFRLNATALEDGISTPKPRGAS